MIFKQHCAWHSVGFRIIQPISTLLTYYTTFLLIIIIGYVLIYLKYLNLKIKYYIGTRRYVSFSHKIVCLDTNNISGTKTSSKLSGITVKCKKNGDDTLNGVDLYARQKIWTCFYRLCSMHMI